jgi:trigger factor
MFGWMKKEKNEAAPKSGAGRAAVKEKPLGDLKVKVKERKGCAAELAVEVPADRVEAALEESFERVRAKVKMPGFRAGKVPLDVVKKNFPEAAWDDAVDRLLRESVHQAVEDEKIPLVSVPTVNKVDGQPGKALKFEVTLECAPDVSVKDYKGLPVQKKALSVGEADLEKRLADLRDAHAKLILSKDAAVAGHHFVVVNYDSFLNGVAVTNGQAKDQLIEMSAAQNVKGFTEGLIGAKDGETRDIPVEFPENHPQKTLAGKTVNFKVTVTAIKEKSLPALDDDFAKDVGAASLDELKTKLRKDLEATQARAQRQDLEKQVIDGLLTRNPFAVPPSQVEERAKHLTEQLKHFLREQGASEDEWTANQDKLMERNRPEAERQVRLSYILGKIIDEEKLAVNDQDVEVQVRKIVDTIAPERRADAEKWMDGRRDTLRAQLREEKLFDFLIQNAKVTEPAA